MNITSASGEKYWDIKRYFHPLPFQDCFVFHLITLFLKGFPVLRDLLKSAFEKKWQRKMLKNLEKLSNN